jgi:Cys-rich peptide (Clo7bot family)
LLNENRRSKKVKFIKKPTKKFEEGYCFLSCSDDCGFLCGLNCGTYSGCGSNSGCISYTA